jgi:hypothetical protein
MSAMALPVPHNGVGAAPPTDTGAFGQLDPEPAAAEMGSLFDRMVEELKPQVSEEIVVQVAGDVPGAVIDAEAEGVLAMNRGERIGKLPFRNERTAVGVPRSAAAA